MPAAAALPNSGRQSGTARLLGSQGGLSSWRAIACMQTGWHRDVHDWMCICAALNGLGTVLHEACTSAWLPGSHELGRAADTAEERLLLACVRCA